MHDRRRRRPGQRRVQVIADDEVLHASCCELVSHARTGPARSPPSLQCVKHADRCRRGERDRVPDEPRNLTQCLHGLVSWGAPKVVREGGTGDEERPTAVLCPRLEEFHRLLPVLGDGNEGAAWRQLPHQRRESGAESSQQGKTGHRERNYSPARPTAGERERPRQEVDEPHDQGQSEDRIELMRVAKGHERAVEQPARRLGQEAVHRSDVSPGDEDDPRKYQRDDEYSFGHAPQGQPCESQGRHDHRVGDHDRHRDEEPPRSPHGSASIRDEGKPMLGATNRLRHAREARGDRGVLDVVEEGRAHLAQDHERPDPP